MLQSVQSYHPHETPKSGSLKPSSYAKKKIQKKLDIVSALLYIGVVKGAKCLNQTKTKEKQKMKIKGKITKVLESSGTYRDKITGQSVTFDSTNALVDVDGDLIEARLEKSDRSPVPAEILVIGKEFTFTLKKYEAGRLVANGTLILEKA